MVDGPSREASWAANQAHFHLRNGARLSRRCALSNTPTCPIVADDARRSNGVTETLRRDSLLKTGALQDAIFNSANFSSIATDEKGVIQIFNVGAERMLGFAAADVVNKITPADISDPQEVVARAKELSASSRRR